MHSNLFTSLETPPSVNEVRDLLASGVTHFDFDLGQPGGPEAARLIRQSDGHVAAYHVGGGGGRAWGSVAEGEQVRDYREQPELDLLTADVVGLVELGANSIHFDNTHRMSGRTLGKVTAAIVAGGAQLVLKNNPEKWNLLLKRAPELLEHFAYAVVEGAFGDKWETEQSALLAERGLTVFVIAFEKGFDKGSRRVSPEKAAAYAEKNPWARVILMADEKAYDSRGAKLFDYAG